MGIRWHGLYLRSSLIGSNSSCSKQHLTVAREAFIGVHPTGPWYLHDIGTPAERIFHVSHFCILSESTLFSIG